MDKMQMDAMIPTGNVRAEAQEAEYYCKEPILAEPVQSHAEEEMGQAP